MRKRATIQEESDKNLGGTTQPREGKHELTERDTQSLMRKQAVMCEESAIYSMDEKVSDAWFFK